MFGGRGKRSEIGPELDWLNDDNREGLSDGKDECTPAIRKPRSRRLPRATAHGGTGVPIGRNAGGHVEAGMESEEGTAFEFLPRREPCRSPFGSPAKRRFDRSQKWQDEFETHSENLTAMEAQSSTGLPKVKTASLCDDILSTLDILILWGGFFDAIQREDRRDSDFPNPLPGVRLLTVILPAA